MGSVRENIQVSQSPSRCPYCHDALDSLEEINACAGCGARHHSECFGEHGACASCGETARLVPEKSQGSLATASTLSLDSVLEKLPEGSLELTRAEDGGASVAWPMIPEKQKKGTYLFALCTLPLLFGFYVLYWIWRYRHLSAQLSLEEDRFKIERPGSALERLSVEGHRSDIDAIKIKDDGLFVTVRGKEELWIGSRGFGHVLEAGEVFALYQVLRSWKDASRRPKPKKIEKKKE